MQGQVGTCIVKSRENTDILNDHTVQARLIQLFYKPDKIRKLILAGKDIGGQIDLSLEDMRLCQGLYDLFRGKIIRVSPGAEALAAQIDRIRACAEGTDQRLFASCGRKKLNSMRI